MPDPRLDSLLKYATQAVVADAAGRSSDPTGAALWDEFQRLRARVDVLERTPTIQTVSGTPTVPARDGTPAVDQAQPRLWIRRNGGWQFATLT